MSARAIALFLVLTPAWGWAEPAKKQDNPLGVTASGSVTPASISELPAGPEPAVQAVPDPAQPAQVQPPKTGFGRPLKAKRKSLLKPAPKPAPQKQ